MFWPQKILILSQLFYKFISSKTKIYPENYHSSICLMEGLGFFPTQIYRSTFLPFLCSYWEVRCRYCRKLVNVMFLKVERSLEHCEVWCLSWDVSEALSSLWKHCEGWCSSWNVLRLSLCLETLQAPMAGWGTSASGRAGDKDQQWSAPVVNREKTQVF